jgi:predicted GNAT family acetyltransferase
MSEDIQVRENSDESRYEIYVDDALAGFTEFARHGDEIDFLHTEIDKNFGGRGLASHLIRHVLDDARRRGLQVMPYCPFVRKFIVEHADYRDLVPAAQHERFGLAG